MGVIPGPAAPRLGDKARAEMTAAVVARVAERERVVQPEPGEAAAQGPEVLPDWADRQVREV